MHFLIPGIYRERVRSSNATSTAPSPQRLGFAFRVATILFVAAVVVLLLFVHRGRINGTPYYTWRWRSLPILGTYPFILPMAIPFFWGQHVYQKNKSAILPALLLVTLSSFLLMVASAMTQQRPPGLAPIAHVVQDIKRSGYYTQAANLNASGLTINQWLARYPQLLSSFPLHPRTKPPGLLLCCAMMFAAFGAGKITPLIIGLMIAAVATLAVPATYGFIAFFTGDRRAAFYGSSYLALCPSLLLIFPQFDQCFILLTVALAISWALALKKNSAPIAAGFGILFAASLFISYLPSVLVFFFAVLAILKLVTYPEMKFSRVATLTGWALAGFIAFYVTLWMATRFNPVAAFRACMATQRENMQWLEANALGRHLPGTIPWDLYDFALGSGWISFLLLGYYLWFRARTDPRAASAKMAILCIGQFVFVALTGMIQCETARVWMFMLPMLMVPIGLELSAWNYRACKIVYSTLFLITLASFSNLTFFAP